MAVASVPEGKVVSGEALPLRRKKLSPSCSGTPNNQISSFASLNANDWIFADWQGADNSRMCAVNMAMSEPIVPCVGLIRVSRQGT